MAAPSGQAMADILAPHKGILMRQKLDLLDIFCPALGKENKYKVAARPEDKDTADPSEWEDKTFKKALKKSEILTLKEKSSFCCRVCCRSAREFTMKIKTGDSVDDDSSTVAQLYRPFKCTCLVCGFLMLNPQEIQVRPPKFDADSEEDVQSKPLGRVRQLWQIPGSCFCSRYWEVMDEDDSAKYVIRQNLCSTNMCAPSLCCPVHTIEIWDAKQENKVGAILNLFPGCNWRGCVGDADNYMIDFPKDATPQDKSNLLAANVLIDYMVFEKQPGDDNGVAIG